MEMDVRFYHGYTLSVFCKQGDDYFVQLAEC